MNKRTYQYWPIRLHIVERTPLSGNSWFTWHGWQTGWKGIGHGVFGWTFHLGRLVILFGKDLPRHKAQIIPFPKSAA